MEERTEEEVGYELELEDEEDELLEEIIRAKWSMDGATTLTEAASQLRSYAEALERLAADGWELTRPVEDDYGFIKQKEG